MLFSLAEKKSSNPTMESQMYQPIRVEYYLQGNFIFFDFNQSESSFSGHRMFNKFIVNQTELSSTSHGFFNIFDIKQSSIPSQLMFLVISNQSEVFTDFKVLFRSEPNYVSETFQSIIFIETLKILPNTIDTKVRFCVWFILFFRYSIQILKLRSKFFRFVLFLISEKKLPKHTILSPSIWYIVILTTGSLLGLDNQLKDFLTNLDFVFVSSSK